MRKRQSVFRVSFFLKKDNEDEGLSLLTKTYDDSNNSVSVGYNRSSTEQDTITTICDDYGKITRVSSGGKKLSSEYQTDSKGCPESKSLANILKMTDNFSGQTFSYTYDKYTGKPTKYTMTDGEDTLNVKCEGNNKILYDFSISDLPFRDEIQYDSTRLLSPRVMRTSNNNVAGVEFDYEYDHLGRCTKSTDTPYALKLQLPTISRKYQNGTFLLNELHYESPLFSGNVNVRVNETYDRRGNPLEIKMTEGSNSSKILMTCNYTYDDLNRLTKEVVNGKKSFTKEYSYNSDGTISSVKENGVESTYIYALGRLTGVRQNGRMIEQYQYDNCGNPTMFKGSTRPMTWKRGTFLKSYGDVSYTYDGQGKIVKSNNGTRTRKLYHDGDKLIAEKVGDKKIRYFYDLDGVSGFKIDLNNKYHYIKDAQGNVVALTAEKPVSGLASVTYQDIIAYYHYDAFGNAKIVDKNGKQIVESDNLNNPAVLNPFRWKSQYYDSDTKLYYIDKRWYDPERGRFISAASPECLIENAATVFALNLYAFALSNPVAVMLACGSIYPSLDFYFDGELGIWERYWRQIVLGIGIAATIIAVVLAPFTCGGSVGVGAAIATTLFNIAMGTVIGAATTLAIGGITAGISSALKGNGFWNGFAEYYASVNLADVLLTSFAFAAVGVAISNAVGAVQCFKEGTLVVTDEGLKPIEEIKVGDKVLAYDETTGEQAYKEVVRLFRNETDEWCHITANGEELVCTGGHPFFVKDKGFVSAKDLSVGDILHLSDGALVAILAIAIEKLTKPETTYNFEVADFHTYYVGESEVLVHNDCISKELTKIANKYKDFECVECADEMKNYLLSKGVNPEQIQIRFSGLGNHNNVWSESLGRVISYNGYHTGVVYKGMVYDNLFKTGLEYNKWVGDFIGFGTVKIF